MIVNELTGDSMSQAEEEYIRVIEVLSKTKVGFPIQVLVNVAHRSAYWRINDGTIYSREAVGSI